MLFLNKVIITKSIPFEIRTENGYSPRYEAMLLKEVEHSKKYGKRFDNSEEMFREISK